MSRDVLAAISAAINDSRNVPIKRELIEVYGAIDAVFAAAHASLAARDLAEQMAADDRLRAALAACEPTDTDHNREAVDGLCVEENDDEQ